MSWKDAIKNIVFDDNDGKGVPTQPMGFPNGSPPGATPHVSYTPPGVADPEKVKKLVAKACAGSAILGQFMTAFDRAAKFFANDEPGRVRSALSNMDVDKSTIVVEITRVTEEGIANIRSEVENARKSAYDQRVGSLERGLKAARDEITQLQSALDAKQQSIAPMEAQIKAARDELAQRDAASTASLTEAERFLGRLKQTVEQL